SSINKTATTTNTQGFAQRRPATPAFLGVAAEKRVARLGPTAAPSPPSTRVALLVSIVVGAAVSCSGRLSVVQSAAPIAWGCAGVVVRACVEASAGSSLGAATVRGAT